MNDQPSWPVHGSLDGITKDFLDRHSTEFERKRQANEAKKAKAASAAESEAS